jgi:hypothetical protein
MKFGPNPDSTQGEVMEFRHDVIAAPHTAGNPLHAKSYLSINFIFKGYCMN